MHFKKHSLIDWAKRRSKSLLGENRRLYVYLSDYDLKGTVDHNYMKFYGQARPSNTIFNLNYEKHWPKGCKDTYKGEVSVLREQLDTYKHKYEIPKILYLYNVQIIKHKYKIL